MFEQHLKELEDQHLLRRLRTITSATGPTVVLNNRPVILLSSNNYLGLATHPAVVEAAISVPGNTERDPEHLDLYVALSHPTRRSKQPLLDSNARKQPLHLRQDTYSISASFQPLSAREA